MSSVDDTSRWGLLPIAAAVAVAATWRAAVVTSPRPLDRHALLRGAVFFVGATVATVRAVGAVDRLDQETLFGALVIVTTILYLVRRDAVATPLPWRRLVTGETAPVVAVAAAGVVVAALAAYLLPVWQWDALGYHLPYVDFALQAGSRSGVPADVPYIGTYPHAVEDFFIAWRAMLSDDRLVDAAQMPLGLLGAGAIAVLGRDLGARHDHALAAGLLWLCLPAVFLQLPTDYVDVGTAAFLLSAGVFVLAEPTTENVVAAGVALGLLLGAKPNAPVPVAVLSGVLVVRAARAGHGRAAVAAMACALALGAESYVTNLLRHGNPVWPVKVTLGSLTLPGRLPMAALLDSGCMAPRLHGSLLVRIARSWTSLTAPPAFDMRFGGLGVVFLAALPAALVAARRQSAGLALVAAAALASPDPSVPRYVLAFPGLVLALAVAGLERASPAVRRLALGGAALAAAVALFRAAPGLTGEGPPLERYLGMTEAERLRAVGANGSPAPFYDALDRLAPGDVTAFDGSLELVYLAWPPDLSTEAERVRDDLTPAEAERIVGDPRVRLLVVDDGSPLARAARINDRFVELHREKPRPPPTCLAKDSSLPLFETSTCVILFRH